ncbi:hypothetical protein GF327_08345 [Candidatus Woesearchaeota archaeon]|nr:hypothetical protein [Candidatus Woesearchaeota archaeon]
MKKSQMSLEYLLLTGFILIALIIPSMFLLHTFIGKNVYGSLNTRIANDLGASLTESAKELYFLGLYSKQKVEVEVPENTKKFFILDLNKSNSHVYYIILKTFNNKSFHFLSDIPLTSKDSAEVKIIKQTDPSYAEFTKEVPECKKSTINCLFYSFEGNILFQGKKTFKLETIYSQENNEIKVSIVPE